MEEKRVIETDAPEKEHYRPRPLWQVWAARAGLVLFLIFVACQVLLLFRGGL